jgi:hypothetical protein
MYTNNPKLYQKGEGSQEIAGIGNFMYFCYVRRHSSINPPQVDKLTILSEIEGHKPYPLG